MKDTSKAQLIKKLAGLGKAAQTESLEALAASSHVSEETKVFLRNVAPDPGEEWEDFKVLPGIFETRAAAEAAVGELCSPLNDWMYNPVVQLPGMVALMEGGHYDEGGLDWIPATLVLAILADD